MDIWIKISALILAVFSPLAAYAFKQDRELDRLRSKVQMLEGQHRLDNEQANHRINDVKEESNTNFKEVKELLFDLSKEVREEHKNLTNSLTRLTVTLERFTQEVQEQKENNNKRFHIIEQELRTKSKG